MAEKEGFEPSIPFWGIHDFQSCALGQLRDFSISAAISLLILQHFLPFVNPYFAKNATDFRFQKISVDIIRKNRYNTEACYCGSVGRAADS